MYLPRVRDPYRNQAWRTNILKNFYQEGSLDIKCRKCKIRFNIQTNIPSIFFHFKLGFSGRFWIRTFGWIEWELHKANYRTPYSIHWNSWRKEDKLEVINIQDTQHPAVKWGNFWGVVHYRRLINNSQKSQDQTWVIVRPRLKVTCIYTGRPTKKFGRFSTSCLRPKECPKVLGALIFRM